MTGDPGPYARFWAVVGGSHRQSVRQANSRAENTGVAEPTEAAQLKGADVAAEALTSHVSDDELARFGNLVSVRRV